MDQMGICSAHNIITFFSPEEMGTPKKSMQHKGKTGRAAFGDASGSAVSLSPVQEHHLLGGSAAGSSPEPGSECCSRD